MASIPNVFLHILEGPESAVVEVSYRIDPTHQDLATGQSYREIVELFGIDEGPGEDGTNELLPNGRIFDQVFSFAQPVPPRTRSARLPVSAIDEDPSPFPRRDEIRARVTLLAVPSTVQAESNLVTRGGLVLGSTEAATV